MVTSMISNHTYAVTTASNIWYADSEHMTNRREWFDTFEAIPMGYMLFR
jgi:hypothetical protein